MMFVYALSVAMACTRVTRSGSSNCVTTNFKSGALPFAFAWCLLWDRVVVLFDWPTGVASAGPGVPLL